MQYIRIRMKGPTNPVATELADGAVPSNGVFNNRTQFFIIPPRLDILTRLDPRIVRRLQ